MDLGALSFIEPITGPDILADIATLPTEDDLPYDDGEPMETARHREQMELLMTSLQAYRSDRTDYYVGGNMFLHYDPSTVIIELLSESTREVDKGEKKTLYARVFRTPEYYLYDPISQEFIAYHLHGPHYEEVKPDVEGKIASPSTGLFLAVRNDWLRWLTADGEPLLSPMELWQQERQHARQLAQRAEQAEQRAGQAEQRAEQAEQLLEEYRRRFGDLKE